MKSKHRTAAKAKRRKYWADPGVLGRMISMVTPYTETDVAILDNRGRLAFERLRSGVGTGADFVELCTTINTASIYALSIDPLCEQIGRAAALAIERCEERHARTGQWGFDGPALQEIAEALDLHTEMMRNSTPAQLTAACVQQSAMLRARGIVA